MGITIKELASLCGVSRGTVDRALNGRGNINEETKKNILDLAELHGYKPHYAAQSLSKGRTNTIGFIVFDLYNEFFSGIIHAAQEEAIKRGYTLQIMVSNKDGATEEKCFDEMLRRNVDGLILCSAISEKAYIDRLKTCSKPIISIGNRINNEIPFMGINDNLAMAEATLHIVKKGYSKIVYVSPYLKELKSNNKNIYALQERYNGYSQVIKSTSISSEDLLKLNYLDKLTSLIATNEKVAFLCHSDFYALEIINKIKEVKGSIPEHIGIMGFDNISILKYCLPKLTTVDYPTKNVGSFAVNSLINNLEASTEIKDCLFDFEIINRDTI